MIKVVLLFVVMLFHKLLFNLWSNIQIIRTYILKYNISNSVSLTIKYLDFETLHYCFKHVSDKVMCHILDNAENIKKIHFPT